MSEHTRPVQRLVKLHNLFSTGRKFTVEEIQTYYQNEDTPVKIRTVYSDLQKLQDQFKAPLAKEGNRYFYDAPFALLDQLTPEDFELIEKARQVLSGLAKLPPVAGFEKVFLKIRDRLRKNQEIERLIDFEENEYYLGLKWLEPLYDGIIQQKSLKITYQDFQKPARTYSLSPYLLKEYRNRWHVYGFEMTKKRIYNLALDRIVKIEPSDFVFRPLTSSELYFLDEIIGFTHTYDPMTESYAPLEEVILAVKEPRAGYIRTKPLHKSQREMVRQESEWALFGYWIRQNKELVSTILELGQDARVISPPSLQAKLLEHARGMMDWYQTSAEAKT